jgi:hypothetical protein
MVEVLSASSVAVISPSVTEMRVVTIAKRRELPIA